MATTAQIAQLRSYINEPDNVEPWTDEKLGALIDAAKSVEAAAGDVWRGKASSYAELVDVQEGSSRRALSKLYEQALKMAASFDADAGGGAGGVRVSRTRRIERP